MEKNISYPKKKVGIQKKYKIDNFRFQRYKPYKDSNIGCIQISCWVVGDMYKSTYAIHRDLKRSWKEASIGYEDGLGRRLLFVPDTNEGMLKNTKSFLQIDVQFELEGLSQYMDELIYDVIEDFLMDTIEGTKLKIV